MILCFDVEADNLLRKATKIHLICVADVDSGRTWAFREDRLTDAVDLLNTADRVVAHSGISYDVPVIERLVGRRITTPCVDTLLLSRLLHPDRTQHPAGGNGLADWGALFGLPKIDHSDFSGWSPEMETYCHRDVEITTKVFHRLLGPARACRDAVRLEHDVAKIILQQELNGVGFDEGSASALRGTLDTELQRIETDLQRSFPAKPIQLKTKVKWQKFNPGSRQQIAERLMELGWTPTERTKPTTTYPDGQVKVDESVLSTINMPEAPLLERYLLLQKRIGQLAQWLSLNEGGVIHGGVNTNGCVTGRMSHASPNMAQVPRVGSDYGKECRALFRPTRKGWVQIGCDASGLELRMFGSYLAAYDGGEYVKVLLNGDIHSHTQRLIGADSRDDTKTFTYATLYGSGPGNIAKMLNISVKHACVLMGRFQSGLKMDRLLSQVKIDYSKRKCLTGLDERPLPVRSEHSALNTLLQSAGAVVMKQALCYAAEHSAFGFGDAAFMLNVHDEFQIECEPTVAEELGRHCVDSIRRAGERFNLACPLTGEFKIGNNWSECH